jgi:excisionase family DNA binding protein
MSSNIKVLKICEYCKKEFIARKTTSKTCCDACAKRFYKERQRNSKIAKAELETEIKRRPLAYIKEHELKAIQSKENLTLKEAAVLLNVSPLTLRRWIFAGKLKSSKVGKKHLIKRLDLILVTII